MRKTYFGATRFSVFSPRSVSWRLTRERGAFDPAAYEAALFADVRMEPRIKIFCDLAAPVYQKMAESHEFRHFVYYSTRMPERWTNILRETAEKYPVLCLMPVDSDRLETIGHVTQVMREASASEDALVFLFRIDDDDLLSIDYLDQISEYMHELHAGYGVSLADGYAGLYEAGGYQEFRKHTQILTSIGQGTIGSWNSASAKLNVPQISNHNRTHFRMSVLVSAQRPSFVQTRHVGQDTASREGAGESSESARGDLLTRFRKLREVDSTSELVSQFPTLSRYVESAVIRE